MNLQSIDLNLLVVFEALMEERNVTRAARRVGLSQPAMSNALTRLRRTFDDPLLVRTPSGMKPTPAAQLLIEPVRAALVQLRAALEEMAAPDKPWGELVAVDAAIETGNLPLAEKILSKRSADTLRPVHLRRLARLRRISGVTPLPHEREGPHLKPAYWQRQRELAQALIHARTKVAQARTMQEQP